MKKLFIISILAAAGCTVFAQTNNVPVGTISALPVASGQDLIHLLAVGLITPFIVAGLKKLLPGLPSNFPPVLAPLVGFVGDYLLSHAGVFSSYNPILGFASGLMGTGFREVYDQHKDIFKGNGNSPMLGLVLLISMLSFGLVGCKTPTLQPGGAYAPLTTNSVTGAVTPASAPDPYFYQADALADVLITSIDRVFKVEADNRDLLWKIAPGFKKSLDEIRPQAWEALVLWAKARQAYLLHPTPAGLSELNTVLSRLNQVSDVLTSVPVPVLERQPERNK